MAESSSFSLKVFHRTNRPIIPVIPEKSGRFSKKVFSLLDQVPQTTESTASRPELTVVIVNYNGWSDVVRLVDSLGRAPEVAAGVCEIVVVDNASEGPVPQEARAAGSGCPTDHASGERRVRRRG